MKETLSFSSDHVYSYEEMGFTHEQIVEMYADIFERFGFDKRESEIPELAIANSQWYRQSIKQNLPKSSSGAFFLILSLWSAQDFRIYFHRSCPLSVSLASRAGNFGFCSSAG